MTDSHTEAPGEGQTVFRWVRIHSQDELKKFYEDVMANIRKEAEYMGYAIGLHGSMSRDLDLIAVPWKDDHADKDELARAVQTAALGPEQERFDWTAKPCGRLAISLPICWLEYDDDRPSAGCIDLSVMPAFARSASAARPDLRGFCTDAQAKQLDAIEAQSESATHGPVDRGDAVNLARTIRETDNIENVTRKGWLSLVDAVLRMDEALRTDAGSNKVPEGMVLVPRETLERWANDEYSITASRWTRFRSDIRAMLAACTSQQGDDPRA